MFALDPRLQSDTIDLGDWPLCKVLLMNDANYPWVILVPRRKGAVELLDLNEIEQQQLMKESMQLAQVLKKEFKADKLNIANLGNVVSQLHIHHIVRYKTDAAWPKPVWGAVPAKPYAGEPQQKIVSDLKKWFNLSHATNLKKE
jgi:diadenosine tetraphosphate (Ap4A) HIT family hydrolase